MTGTTGLKVAALAPWAFGLAGHFLTEVPFAGHVALAGATLYLVVLYLEEKSS